MDIQVHLDLPVMVPPGSPLSILFPTVDAAVERMAMSARRQWKAYAMGEPLPTGRTITSRSGSYARSIVGPRKVAEFHYVVESTSPYAEGLERGTRQFDMKLWLRTSTKARVSKDGTRYLIIPFRHGIPGAVTLQAMPQAVHDVARMLEPSRIKSTFQKGNEIGFYLLKTKKLERVTRRKYMWGGRLPDDFHDKRYQGLVRFDAPKGGHSRYMTFRVMSEKSKGWIRPAQPGYWPARSAAEWVEQRSRPLLQAAVERDVANALGGTTTA